MRDEKQRRGDGERPPIRETVAVLTADFLASSEQLGTRPHRRPCDCGACRRWALELVIFGDVGCRP